MHAPRRVHAHVRRRLGAAAAGHAGIFLCGGQWCRERVHECDLSISRFCVRCTRGFVENEFHLIWECADNDELKEARESQLLEGAARLGDAEAPSLWLRGVLSRGVSSRRRRRYRRHL